MYPRVLIVGTVPYNVRSTSRAFDAYFHYWDRERLAQIFSNPKTPCKGHCHTFFQITDHEMVTRWLNPHAEVGREYRFDELTAAWETSEYEISSDSLREAYRLGAKHTALTHILRGILWRKKFWCTDKLNQWLDIFIPECVFLAFSDDFFINQIALYVANKYDIPIVSCIGDDYYFLKPKRWSILERIYRSTYRKLIREVFKKTRNCLYISDKIRDVYNSAFNLCGDTVYLASSIERKPFKPINIRRPVITYFGNLGLGRAESLIEIAEALGSINREYRLEVYSSVDNPNQTQPLKEHPFISYCGSIPYNRVLERMAQSDVTVVVEGFCEDDVNKTRYSLSTKAADALASGASILAYGSAECGIIEYLNSTEAASVCTNTEELEQCIRMMIFNVDSQREKYKKAIEATALNHNLQSSTKKATYLIKSAIVNYKSGEID